MRTVQPSQPVATEASAQRRVRRPTTRLRVYPQYQYDWVPDVYPRYNPGPNAVRDCNATYVGIPAERHRDRAPHELFLAAWLAKRSTTGLIQRS
jgi:hypothetical protein